MQARRMYGCKCKINEYTDVGQSDDRRVPLSPSVPGSTCKLGKHVQPSISERPDNNNTKDATVGFVSPTCTSLRFRERIKLYRAAYVSLGQQSVWPWICGAPENAHRRRPFGRRQLTIPLDTCWPKMHLDNILPKLFQLNLGRPARKHQLAYGLQCGHNKQQLCRICRSARRHNPKAHPASKTAPRDHRVESAFGITNNDFVEIVNLSRFVCCLCWYTCALVNSEWCSTMSACR